MKSSVKKRKRIDLKLVFKRTINSYCLEKRPKIIKVSKKYVSQLEEIFTEYPDILNYRESEEPEVLIVKTFTFELIKLFPTDKAKEKLFKEFLNKLASSDIISIKDLIDLEQEIEQFVQSIEV